MKRRWQATKRTAGQGAEEGGGGASTSVDYMSEAFVAGMEKEAEVKRGKGPPQPPPQLKSKATIHEEARVKLQEGLNRPLSDENRGLKLLKLMGYREGMGLGRSVEGIKEPIKIEVATQRRSGLGIVQEHKEKRQQAAIRRKELTVLRTQYLEQHQQAFKESMSNRFAEKRIGGQLSRARKTVETLDSRLGRGRSFLWPPEAAEEEEQPGDLDHAGFHDRGDNKVLSLEDDRDVGEAGDSEEEQEKDTEEEAEEEEEQAATWCVMPVRDKLVTVLEYLRHDHHYCLFCGHQYDSMEELKAECPGMHEEDH